MRCKVQCIAILAGVLSLATVGANAQQSAPPQDQSMQHPQSQNGTMSGGMMGQGAGQGNAQQGMGMMGAGQPGMMNAMMEHYQQMTELLDKLMQSETVLQNEKDPAALKSELAEHKVLLEQMQQEMKMQGGMMQDFGGQGMKCPMAGGTPNNDTPSK